MVENCQTDNRSRSRAVPRKEELRLTAILGYHFDEPSIIDVTSY
jgi:hypothetical protein